MIKTVGILLSVSIMLPVGAAELPQIDGIDESSVLENYKYTSIADEIDKIVNGGVIAEKSMLPENSGLSLSQQWDFPPLPKTAEDGSQYQGFEQNKEITVFRRKELFDELNNRNKTEKPILPQIEGNTNIKALNWISDIKELVRE